MVLRVKNVNFFLPTVIENFGHTESNFSAWQAWYRGQVGVNQGLLQGRCLNCSELFRPKW